MVIWKLLSRQMNNRTIKQLLFTIACIIASFGDNTAQQFPIYSQYLFNGLTLNPAFAGSAVQMSLTSVYRNQWVNFEGAPITYSFSAHSTLNSDKVGVGLLIDHDEIGSYSNNHVYGSYAYIFKTPKGKLALGLQAGFNVLSTDFSDLNLDNFNDNSFGSIDNKFKPNFGAGIYYHNDIFFAGFSVPFLLNNKISTSLDGIVSQISEARYYYLNGGVTLPLNRMETIALMPSLLVRAQEGSPLSLDINASLAFYKSFSIGVSYRNIDAIVSFIDIKINDHFLFAYSYDWTTSEINKFSSGTHEFMLNYRFKIEKYHGNDVCPDYFRH